MANAFFVKLKEQATENPILAIGVAIAAVSAGTSAVTATAKIVDASASVSSRRAYAKQVKNSAKKNK